MIIECIESAKALDGYRIEVRFEDGAHGVVDRSDRLFGPMFQPLQDPERFAQRTVDEFGAIC